MLDLRLRSCHLHGSFVAKDNRRPPMTRQGRDREPHPRRQPDRPAARELPARAGEDRTSAGRPRCGSSRSAASTRCIHDDAADVGIIMQGGLYNTRQPLARAARLLRRVRRHRDPAVRHERHLPGGRRRDRRVLRGQARGAAASRRVSPTTSSRTSTRSCAATASTRRCTARTCCRWPASTPRRRSRAGVAEFLRTVPARRDRARAGAAARPRRPGEPVRRRASPPRSCQPRPPGLCTGCPERPIFAGMKLAERETGEHHVSADIGCHLFAINAPFDIGATTMGYGLGLGRRGRAERPRTPTAARSRSWATAASGTTA